MPDSQIATSAAAGQAAPDALHCDACGEIIHRPKDEEGGDDCYQVRYGGLGNDGDFEPDEDRAYYHEHHGHPTPEGMDKLAAITERLQNLRVALHSKSADAYRFAQEAEHDGEDSDAEDMAGEVYDNAAAEIGRALSETLGATPYDFDKLPPSVGYICPKCGHFEESQDGADQHAAFSHPVPEWPRACSDSWTDDHGKEHPCALDHKDDEPNSIGEVGHRCECGLDWTGPLVPAPAPAPADGSNLTAEEQAREEA